MLNTQFVDKLDFDTYLAEQKVRQQNGYLTVSERKQLTSMLDKNYKPLLIGVVIPKLPIVTNVRELRKPCQEVTKEDNIKEIIQKLKDTLENHGGIGLSANQIGIQKKISYVKVPKLDNKNKEIQYNEYILINTKIIEKERPIKVNNESCLSFPGIGVITKRYIFIIVQYLNEKMELQNGIFQDLESLVVQHECDHQIGIVLFDRKWVTK